MLFFMMLASFVFDICSMTAITAGEKLNETIQLLMPHAEVEQFSSDTSIVLMQNFDPSDWEHVHVNLDKVNDLATELVKINHLKIADWTKILPPGLEMKELVDYIMGLICIDFCHWDLKPKQEENGIRDFYTKDDQGINLRGSAAMTALAKKAYQNGVKIFDATFMAKVTIADLRPHFMGIDNEGNLMEIPWLEKRVRVMNEVGRILLEKWEGSFCNVLLPS